MRASHVRDWGSNPHSSISFCCSNSTSEIFREGGSFYYFENGGAVSALERKIAIYMRNDTTRSILEIIGHTSGINQADIAGLLHITQPTVIWHIRKLIRDGIVEE
jgi:predicted transcriptional regulator